MNEEKKCCGSGDRGKIILIILGMLLLAGIITIAILRDRLVNQNQYQVAVTGQGKITYEPDIANITLGVQIDKTVKADEALRQMNSKMDNVIKVLKTNGILPADIETQTYSLSPQYDYNNGVATSSGYIANEQILVKVRGVQNNSAKISQIVGVASNAGANQILGINFDLSNVESLKQQARIMAIADAKIKAQTLAAAAGVKLGEVVGWWENIIQAPNMSNVGYTGDLSKGGIGGAGNSSVSPNIPNGAQEIIIEESVNYKIK